MTRRLAHRGPNGEGVEYLELGALGHRRLSILDLSPLGAQPMWDVSKRFCISYNGEIYNYLELRKELEHVGCQFRSRSDTEVLLEAYKQWGIDSVSRFNGMFAFAIWDSRKRELFLSRDRLGKKPIYYTFSESYFAFASELKSLLALPGTNFQLSNESLDDYLVFGHTSSSQSILRDIKKLPRACWMSVRIAPGKAPAISQGPLNYWSLPEESGEVDPAAYDEHVGQLLQSATEYRLRSDVPVGLFLSGGVDSSVVACLATEKLGTPLRSFTSKLPLASIDESKYAAETARRFGCQAVEDSMGTPSESEIDSLIHHFDEPFADESAIAIMRLAQLASSTTRVVLTGDGGDETFGGYTRYYQFPRWWRRTQITRDFFGSMTGHLARLYPIHLTGAGQLTRVTLRAARAYAASMSIFNQRELAFARGDNSYQTRSDELQFYDRAFDDVQSVSPRVLNRLDFDTYLPEQILVKVDRATMAFGVEARAPFLDYRLIELQFRHALRSELRGKATLRRLFGERLPEGVFRPKQGFTMPLQQWLGNELAWLLDAMFDDHHFFASVGLNRKRVLKLHGAHQLRLRDNSHKLWALLVFWKWYRHWRAVRAETLVEHRVPGFAAIA